MLVNSGSVDSPSTALALEPNDKLLFPYAYMPKGCKVARVSTIKQGIYRLDSLEPDLIFLSASYSLVKSLTFLETLKNVCVDRLIPLIVVIDFGNSINFVPGTNWGGKIAVLTSNSSRQELFYTLGGL